MLSHPDAGRPFTFHFQNICQEVLVRLSLTAVFLVCCRLSPYIYVNIVVIFEIIFIISWWNLSQEIVYNRNYNRSIMSSVTFLTLYYDSSNFMMLSFFLFLSVRIRPFSVLLALKTYEKGKAEKGKLTWTPNGAIVDALTAMYYNSFKVI